MLAAPIAKQMVFADWTYSMSRSMLRQMIAVVSRPGILSFAGGLPAPDLFPTSEYGQAMAHVLYTDASALQYGPPSPSLKRHIVQLMDQRGVKVFEEQVFLTTGAQQGLDVLTRLLLNHGGEVILEELIYSGVQQAVAPLQPDVLTVSTDLHTGIDVDGVEAWLAEGARPAFIYVIPDAHNPLGVDVSLEKRQRLASLARQYGVPIIEDDPYGHLRYDGSFVPPVRALDDEWVFYLGSFSKILAPALRLGWIIAPESLVPKLTVIKEAGDLESSGLTQRAVAAYLDAGHFSAHLGRIRDEYGRRLDAMLMALNRYFPASAQWTHPSGGMFVWVRLAPEIDATELLHLAIEEEQVAFIPGNAFAVNSPHSVADRHAKHSLRLNFSNSTPPQIVDGIQRLSRVLHR